jgi:hypothetical protein
MLVKIRNPADGSVGTCTEEAFEVFWKDKGWTDAGEAAVTATQPPPDYSSMLRDELVEEAKARGLATSGTKDELVERLNAAG